MERRSSRLSQASAASKDSIGSLSTQASPVDTSAPNLPTDSNTRVGVRKLGSKKNNHTGKLPPKRGSRIVYAALLIGAWYLGTRSSPADVIFRTIYWRADQLINYFNSDSSWGVQPWIDIDTSSLGTGPSLHEQSKEFSKRIEHVVANVYVAIGYGLANCVFIDGGKEGLVIVDALEGIGPMTEALKDFRESRTQAHNTNSTDTHHHYHHQHFHDRVVALVYTHFHTDHTFGAAAVVEPGFTQVWAHEVTRQELEKVFQVTAGVTYRRSMHQFGALLHDSDGYINAGIGPRLRFAEHTEIGFVAPTRTWSGSEQTIHVGGETLVMMFAPGESKDQIVIWMPKHELLIGADNIYKAFPNIYAIRGTETRNTKEWTESLDMMRRLQAEYLVLGHTSPVYGKQFIADTLLAYRDAIQYVHDQTVRLMNKGYHRSEIATTLELPPHLKSHPFLAEFYGTVEWSVKGVYTHYVGWYGGSPDELFTMHPMERAKKMADLAQRQTNIEAEVKQALADGEYQWALELASLAHTLYGGPEQQQLLKEAMVRMGLSLNVANGRNWLITASKHLSQNFDLAISPERRRNTVNRMNSMADLFGFIPTRLKAEATLDTDLALLFSFEDTGEGVCIHVRRGIAQVHSGLECYDKEPDSVYSTDTLTWKQIINGDIYPAMAVARGQLKAKEGTIFDLVKLMSYVEYSQ
eukprot:Selendium_serpulae@DN3414_c0_g1_i2.p1